MTLPARENECSGKPAEKSPLNPSNQGVESSAGGAGAKYMYGHYGLTWDGTTLRRGKRKLMTIEQDAVSPWMWRVRLPTGRLTDMLNISCAKDYACRTALRLFDIEP